MIAFTIPVDPRSMQYHKRVVVKDGKPMFFTSKAKRRYFDDIAIVANVHAPPSPLEGPIKLLILFGLKRPKYFDKPKKNPAKAARGVHHTAKPDLTNLLKAIEDALAPCGFWSDDCQVSATAMRKVYVKPGDQPFIRINIDTIPEYYDY